MHGRTFHSTTMFNAVHEVTGTTFECSTDRSKIESLVNNVKGLVLEVSVTEVRRRTYRASENPTPGYCTFCEHPHGYHDKERGCTMPVNAAGIPIASGEAETPCKCPGEEQS